MNSFVSMILGALRLLNVHLTSLEQPSELHSQMQALSAEQLRCVAGGAPKGSWLDGGD